VTTSGAGKTQVRDPPEVLARFHGNLDLVDIVAKQTFRRVGQAIALEDLTAFGQEGLLRAARSFDEERGVPFRRWASVRITGAVIDGVRAWGRLPKRLYRELAAAQAASDVAEAYDEEFSAMPVSSPEGASERLTTYLTSMATALAVGGASGSSRESVDVDADGNAVTPEELVAREEFGARVRAVVAKLPERERAIVEKHYFGGITLDDAAASLGLSKSWGSRLHARAIEAITKELHRSGDL